MNKTILYSAVGMTDPISNFRDGSLLHICRIYKPDKVYILMSREVVKYHNEDNRYIYCLEKLSEKINHPFEIVKIQKDDLVEVQNYDVVYPIIKENIQSILDNMDETDSLIVNIGTDMRFSSPLGATFYMAINTCIILAMAKSSRPCFGISFFI